MKAWIACVLGLALAEPAFACSCLAAKDAADHLAGVDVVFVGQAKATQPRRKAEVVLTTFVVSRTLKGEHATSRSVEHYLASPTCGVQFAPGQEYLILATSRDGRLSTNLCRAPRFPVADYERALKAP